MNKEHILSEIKRTAEANGGVPLGRGTFLAETGIKESDWIGRLWVRWGDALREAGFEPNKLQEAYSDDILMEKFIALTRELGHFPVSAEIRLKARSEDSFPARNTFARFGSKQQFAAKLLNYCKAHSGYEDMMALCAPIAERQPSQERLKAMRHQSPTL